ncbi:ABC transporter ATP-binding protein [Roseivirga sp. E12]|uniref:ABC transporter ATP-binding protein n=1 Tax=Roseivirga sp. E12 TaxID=2819237 RepID=UPI001ABC7416|nr:ABC transporter ATP-binding protein [Roseivirga sp. E12]MBO3698352.1 ABC transporter ATP-binding protein [Roseivirga sp. E12]
MLRATDLRKSYGTLNVLKGVDLHVESEEVLSIVGASGAGKSTLLHILGTLDLADIGSLIIDGKEISQLSVQQLANFRNERIGFIFQFHNLLPEFTALENVCLPGFIGGRPEKEVRKRGHELLGILGLTGRLDHKPSELSGGEQQRVAVARALINDPAIIFADEPSGNLDSKNAAELHGLFFRLRDELKKTFVIVTHNHDLAEMSDRKVEIVDGTISSS